MMKKILILICLLALPIFVFGDVGKIDEFVVQNVAVFSYSDGKIYVSFKPEGGSKGVYELDADNGIALRLLADGLDFGDNMIMIGDSVYKSREDYKDNEFVLVRQGSKKIADTLKLIEKSKIDGKRNMLAYRGSAFENNELIFLMCDADEKFYLGHYDFDTDEFKALRNDAFNVSYFQILDKNRTLFVHNDKKISIYSWLDGSVEKLAQLPNEATGIAYHKGQKCIYYQNCVNHKFIKQDLQGNTEELEELKSFFSEKTNFLGEANIIGDKYIASYFGDEMKIIAIDVGK